jgi:hypothetical protein
MKKPMSVPFATTAILTLAEIKAAVDAFDRGDTNVLDALNTIAVAVEAYRAALTEKPKRSRPTRRAA